MRIRHIAGVLAAIAAAGAPGAAQGALSTTATLPTSAGATRIVVTVKGLGTVPLRQRPTAVRVLAGGATYRLTKVNATRWRSARLPAAAVAKLRTLNGRRITVRLTSRAGVRTLRPVLRVPAPPATPPVTPPSSQPLFAAPGRELTGNEAFTHLSQYFLGSRFTDCPAGWPACAVEQRYNHCSDGNWEYYRLTPYSGSDIKSFGQIQVTGAVVHADGSWGVEYILTAYGQQSFYSWNVGTNGIATGAYWAPGNLPPGTPSESIGPMLWQRPVVCTGSPF